MQYESNKSLEETIRAFEWYIGYVYPHDESSYFICSGGRMKLSYVQCKEKEVCKKRHKKNDRINWYDHPKKAYIYNIEENGGKPQKNIYTSLL